MLFRSKAWLLEGHRVDGRAKNEIRPLAAEVGVLPRVHGSGLFTRGQTQVLSVCTLNTLAACQKLDTCLLYTSHKTSKEELGLMMTGALDLTYKYEDKPAGIALSLIHI